MTDEQKPTTIEDLHQTQKKKSILEDELHVCAVLSLLTGICLLAVGVVGRLLYLVIMSLF